MSCKIARAIPVICTIARRAGRASCAARRRNRLRAFGARLVLSADGASPELILLMPLREAALKGGAWPARCIERLVRRF